MKLMPACGLFVLFLFSLSTEAGIQLHGTRVIYPAGKREVTLSMTNLSPAPRLLQAWVDADGDKSDSIPFIVTPPIFRLDPDKGQTLRIMFTGGNIAQDRESVFWINVLEVQPKPTGHKAAANAIKVSIRSRLKLFYRPPGLPGSPEKAVSLLRWRLVQDGNGYAIECENPGAYNVSFNHVGLKKAPVNDEEKQSGMCPAKGKKNFLLTEAPNNVGGQLMLITIDDFGAYHDHEITY